jgi:four helix bundle protein
MEMHPVELEFIRWEATPPPELYGDAIWRLPAFRLSRYLAHVVDRDVECIRTRSPSLSDQLERSVNSIGTNIAEGYGRLHGRERARFYEFALGSAREAREWYARAERYLPNGIAIGRARLLTRVIKILTAAIPQERAGSSERRIKDAIERAKKKKRVEEDE